MQIYLENFQWNLMLLVLILIIFKRSLLRVHVCYYLNTWWFISNDWFIISCNTPPWRLFYSYTLSLTRCYWQWKGATFIRFYVAERWWILIVSYLLWHGASVFKVSSEGPPHLVASDDLSCLQYRKNAISFVDLQQKYVDM